MVKTENLVIWVFFLEPPKPADELVEWNVGMTGIKENA